MSRSASFERVAQVVADTLEIDIDEISEDTSFDDLGADSFDRLELVTSLEDELGLELDEDVLAKIETIGDAIDAIESAQ